MVDERWRIDELHINSNAPPPRFWCSVLSPEGHKHCDKPYFCGCECHLAESGSKEAKWRWKAYIRPDGRRGHYCIHPYDPHRVRVAGVRA